MSEAPEFSEETIEAARVLCSGSCEFVLGAAALTQLPEADRPEIAFAGRSNVGKSSLINGLLWRKNLARASSEPGRTRELNYFDLGEGRLWLVDLPGFGYAKVSRSQAQEWQRLTLRYLQGRVNLRRVFLLVDSRRGLMDTDHEVMDMLDSAAVTYQIVLTKADKVKRTEADAVRSKVADALRKRPAAHPVIRQTSAEKGWGLPELRAEIYQLTE
ncbi:MAG: YihA family ribosome biogenesis GTP-binding protein [Henriciella sp.]|uniref:ribosome biogenesis GTP-binding protein YihA/YsxC n=1 Tax=Henriciella sp. TaxID=1968823 RepID=UPI000C10EA45|nr:ribosome biogenesis GTP-binding protein YihA/YsxC [Henriciella sp.]MBF33540.1 YihA family ribosome biogenesis GTP-binding protein [Hyphomonadaceae bacterium]MBK76353.1 YihA family ribosome biogenesis GTP-binding protein [Henriciella sp.]PHR70178.1 MAG: YihA family ribosome biogenesis GTP-binding protein [Henriciella sp.]